MSFISGLDLTRNYSLFTVPVAWVICMLPGTWATSVAGSSYDLANPRQYLTTLSSDNKIDKARLQRLMRAQSAMENGFETLGLYAASVAAANHARVDPWWLNVLTVGYLASRVAYIYAYIVLCQNRKLAPVRSGIWAVGAGAITALYVMAGWNLM
ncbi:hypothetical protein BBK36DRAFT_21083 [Trichoderma citrinoviride]|uniref:Membrane-associated proteins in eicosanoid and glutathione metabolism n=1 Tax=Trichoderma citrinoviride TaxID=58853 RepID=A0A2T4B7H1_9HYPO|nr:hypothetical protein BBK36DRAFT_21083 [Trichoderma citrinoviride]PTB65283.1 hypothetical protein BBK36DRAFT_21083 [Trichoderma citrinoviride]